MRLRLDVSSLIGLILVYSLVRVVCWRGACTHRSSLVCLRLIDAPIKVIPKRVLVRGQKPISLTDTVGYAASENTYD
jgi:hypothetical protein